MSDSEEFIPEDEEEMGPAFVKRLREKLKKAVEEKQEYLDGWQRSRADFANFKKSEAAALEAKDEQAKASLIEELIPALDALELALKHDANPTLKMIEKQFLDSLKRLGVEKYGAVGEEFDPHRHEALAQKTDDNIVVTVELSGYSIGNKIIRPAQVII